MFNYQLIIDTLSKREGDYYFTIGFNSKSIWDLFLDNAPNNFRWNSGDFLSKFKNEYDNFDSYGIALAFHIAGSLGKICCGWERIRSMRVDIMAEDLLTDKSIKKYVTLSSRVSEILRNNNQDDIVSYIKNADSELLDFVFIDIDESNNSMWKVISKSKKDKYRLFDSKDIQSYGYSMKPSKFLCKIGLTSTETLTKINAIFSDIENKYKFELVSGDKIKYYYHEDRTSDEAEGTDLWNSCMRYESCQDYINFYCREKNIKMLIKKDTETDLIIGRAIVWTLDDGSIFMDRIYGSTTIQEQFKLYATKQGWNHKQRQNNGTLAEPYIFTITQEIKACTTVPYMDTMKYFNYDAKQLTCEPIDSDIEYYRWCSCEGSWDNE